jgi:hypothetical protein
MESSKVDRSNLRTELRAPLLCFGYQRVILVQPGRSVRHTSTATHRYHPRRLLINHHGSINRRPRNLRSRLRRHVLRRQHRLTGGDWSWTKYKPWQQGHYLQSHLCRYLHLPRPRHDRLLHELDDVRASDRYGRSRTLLHGLLLPKSNHQRSKRNRELDLAKRFDILDQSHRLCLTQHPCLNERLSHSFDRLHWHRECGRVSQPSTSRRDGRQLSNRYRLHLGPASPGSPPTHFERAAGPAAMLGSYTECRPGLVFPFFGPPP